MSFTAFKKVIANINYGNKTGQLARKVGTGKTVEMTVYDLKEVMPQRTDYDGNPYLYFMCEYEGKRGFRVRCNDEECAQAIVNSGKDEYGITVRSELFVSGEGSTKRETPYFSLESYS